MSTATKNNKNNNSNNSTSKKTELSIEQIITETLQTEKNSATEKALAEILLNKDILSVNEIIAIIIRKRLKDANYDVSEYFTQAKTYSMKIKVENNIFKLYCRKDDITLCYENNTQQKIAENLDKSLKQKDKYNTAFSRFFYEKNLKDDFVFNKAYNNVILVLKFFSKELSALNKANKETDSDTKKALENARIQAKNANTDSEIDKATTDKQTA